MATGPEAKMAQPPPSPVPSVSVQAHSPRPSSGLVQSRAYTLRPAFLHKFRTATVKDCIHEVLKEHLSTVQYSPEEIPILTKFLSETIRDRLKEKGFHRYKMVVQVVIGEQRGEGVKQDLRPRVNVSNPKQASVGKNWQKNRPHIELMELVLDSEVSKDMAARCFWDADTDNYAQDVFMNDSLFCVAVAFGCYFY